MEETSSSETRCKNPSCGRLLAQTGGHRQREYCGDTCRQVARRHRVEQAHREEVARRWAMFSVETRGFLDWLTTRSSTGNDLAYAVELAIRRELDRSSVESSTQGERQLAALREKQLRRVEKLKARICQLEQEGQQRAAGPEDQHNIDDYRKKLAQASERISKLEKQVDIQRQQLGQYHARFYPSSLAVAAQKLMALGAAMNYKILLKYDSQAVGVGSGEAAWREFATHASYEEIAQAILQAQHFFDNLYALGMLSKLDTPGSHD